MKITLLVTLLFGLVFLTAVGATEETVNAATAAHDDL